jgi:hypothetical protein
MNVEDQIRFSAREQAHRYRPAGNLGHQIERRRRQRVARRVAATGTCVAILFGAGALLVANRLDGDRGLGPAAPATVSAPPTSAPGAGGGAITTTTAQVAATTAPPASAAPPSTARQSPTSPTAPPLNPSTPAAYAAADGAVWPFGEFWNVPQLGAEAVRGTGCGSTNSLPETIPDGLWAGYVTGHTDTTVSIDLLCIYAVANAGALPSDSAHVVLDAPDYVVVNNSTRSRTMPMDSRIVLRLATRDGAGRCVDGESTQQWTDIAADQQVWVRIHQGAVTWIFAECR